MSKLFKETAFNIGFAAEILFFIGLNYYSLSKNYGNCIDCFGETGIPFSWMDGGWFLERILWIGLIADFLIAIIFSFIVGLIFNFAWSRISQNKLN